MGEELQMVARMAVRWGGAWMGGMGFIKGIPIAITGALPVPVVYVSVLFFLVVEDHTSCS